MSRVSFGLVAEIGTDRYPHIEDAVAKTRRRVLEWIGERAGLPQLVQRDATVSFDESDRPGVKVALALSGDLSQWVAKMERPDDDVAQRTWVTEISIVARAETAFFAVRNTCTAPSDKVELPRSVPRVVRTVSEIVGLYDADEPLDREHWTVSNSADLDDLAALLTNPKRFLPVILVTEPYQLDAQILAKRMYGAAHVVALPDALSHEWASRIGRPFNAFLGAIRTYNPGLNGESSDPFDHPLALANRIRSFSSVTGSGPAAFSRFLLERASESNASRVITDVRALRYSQVSAAALEARRAIAVAAHSADEAQTLAIEEIAAYKKQAEDSVQMEAAALDDNRALKAENDRLIRDLYRMQSQVESFRATAAASGRVVEVQFPNSYDEAAEWVEEQLAGRVLLLPRAIHELSNSDYERSSDIYSALLTLGNEFWRMKTANGERDAFKSRLAELGMDYGGSIDERNANDSYFVSYQERKRFLEKALKKGTSREPRYCLRIYLFWDAERRLSVIGSLPRHLENTLS